VQVRGGAACRLRPAHPSDPPGPWPALPALHPPAWLEARRCCGHPATLPAAALVRAAWGRSCPSCGITPLSARWWRDGAERRLPAGAATAHLPAHGPHRAGLRRQTLGASLSERTVRKMRRAAGAKRPRAQPHRATIANASMGSGAPCQPPPGANGLPHVPRAKDEGSLAPRPYLHPP
jgi:hypothetical protein